MYVNKIPSSPVIRRTWLLSAYCLLSAHAVLVLDTHLLSAYISVIVVWFFINVVATNHHLPAEASTHTHLISVCA